MTDRCSLQSDALSPIVQKKLPNDGYHINYANENQARRRPLMKSHEYFIAGIES